MTFLDQPEMARERVRKHRFTFGGRPRSPKTNDSFHHSASNPPSPTSRKPLKRMPTMMQRLPSHMSGSPDPRMSVEVYSPWSDAMSHWTNLDHNDLSLTTPFESESFSPLPSNISRAAAKRLGITIDSSGAPGSSPLNSRQEWDFPKHKRVESSDSDQGSHLEKSTFYSSDSDDESKKRGSSTYSTDSSRTSYNISMPSPEPEKKQEQEQVDTELEIVKENINPQPLRVTPRRASHTVLLESRTSQSAVSPMGFRARGQSISNPFPQSIPAPVEESRLGNDTARKISQVQDDFQAMLDDRAANIRNRLKGAVAQTPEAQQVPAVPERSRKRLVKRMSSEQPSVTPSRPVTALSPILQPSQWMERRRKSSVPVPLLRVETDFRRPRNLSLVEKIEQQRARNPSIAADAAEHVLLKVFENFTNLHDLFAAARTNRGFYTVFKRNELRLLKRTLQVENPAAWELLEIKIRKTASRSRLKFTPEYTASSYFHTFNRDSYVVNTIRALILSRCEDCIRAETFASLRDRNSDGSRRADEALWRIWTFCTLFANGREDDLTAQINWLCGGSFASTSPDYALETTARTPNMCKDDQSYFGRSNASGLSETDLCDMLDMWVCVKHLLTGILGDGRAAQARKYGVFDALPADLGDVAAADGHLEEWYHCLCTLGLPTILDLANASISKTSRVFNTARDLGLTKWSPLPNGNSRIDFLEIVVERVLLEQQAAARRPVLLVTQPSDTTIPSSFELPSNLGTRFQRVEVYNAGLTASADALDAAIANPATTPGESPEERVMNHWVRYVVGGDACSSNPTHHIASQHDLDRTAPLPELQLQAQSQPQSVLHQQSHALQPQTSNSSLQAPPRRSLETKNLPALPQPAQTPQQQPRLEQFIPPTPQLSQMQLAATTMPPITQVQAAPSPQPKLLSRFNNIHASSSSLKAKFSTPELKQYFDFPIMARP